MRLLQRISPSEFVLTKEFIGDDLVPPYAILSHTWGSDEDEVTFGDLQAGVAKDKTGYRKISFCGEQAHKDGLKYFWIDTCCINKANNAELAEAINSMFRWYRNSARCYVFLSDISAGVYTEDMHQLSQSTFELAFRECRWFTRGWTLQELIAPSSVEFFSIEGTRLGNKKSESLEQLIHEITDLPLAALRGCELSQFTVEERMLWAAKRNTKREEDMAYSLMGLFDVYMSPIYGEGRLHAFVRLREQIDKQSNTSESILSHLSFANDAPFNAYARRHESNCLPETRVDILKEIEAWIDGEDKRFIFWLSGSAGTGKSTIARTIARKYFDEGRLAASFFFSKGGGDVSHAGKFFTTIAVELTKISGALQRSICDAIRQHSDIASMSLSDQWRYLILQPLSNLVGDTQSKSYVLVVDALDECDDNKDIQTIMQLLSEARSLRSPQLRILMTSRPDMVIRHSINHIQTLCRDFALQSVPKRLISHDISIFLEFNFRNLSLEHSLGINWPGDETIRNLVQKSDGLFVWAATAYRYIQEGGKRRFIRSRLSSVLHTGSSSPEILGPEERLNKIYVEVLRESVPGTCSEVETDELVALQKHILGSIVILHSPLAAGSLACLLNLQREDVEDTLDSLHTILDVPKDESHPLRLHHPSFRDFLLDRDRCSDLRFWVDEKQAHSRLTYHCIELLSDSLKQDLCEVNIPGTLVKEVGPARVNRYLSSEVQYACLYWVKHLQRSDIQLTDDGRTSQFLQVHLLHWLEALSWMQKLSEGILEIISLESAALSANCTSLNAFVHDARRFTLHHRLIIERAPLQVYYSALIFTPDTSLVRTQFQDQFSRWIKSGPQIETDWSVTLPILEGGPTAVHAVTFSPDGNFLASGLNDNTIRIWDLATGEMLQALEGHSSAVFAVAFSFDGHQFASGSDDKTVKTWDLSNGRISHTMTGHLDPVCTISFSPSGRVIASGSFDKTIRIYDTTTGNTVQILKGHSDLVRGIAFMPDDERLLSGSYDKTVRIWNTSTAATEHIFEDTSFLYAIACSPDGKQVASGAYDKTVHIWDVATGATVHILQGHSGPIYSVAFSSNRNVKQIASCSYDHTVRIWDTVTGANLRILRGHTDWVRTVSYLRDSSQSMLASGSFDKTIQIWDTGTGESLRVMQVEPVVGTPVYSDKGSYFQTGRGRIALQARQGQSSSTSASPLRHPGTSKEIIVQNEWISLGPNRVIWLPPKYRPARSVVSGSVVELIDKSGRVSTIEFYLG